MRDSFVVKSSTVLFCFISPHSCTLFRVQMVYVSSHMPRIISAILDKTNYFISSFIQFDTPNFPLEKIKNMNYNFIDFSREQS